MATEIAGYILRVKDRQRSARFYEAFGLTVHKHQHGGPMHNEIGPIAADCVTELYQSSESFPQDALMIMVDSISVALEVATKFGCNATTKLRETPGMKFIYVNDPDGRALMLIEKNNNQRHPE